MIKTEMDNDIVKKILYERLDILFEKLEELNKKSNSKLHGDGVSQE